MMKDTAKNAVKKEVAGEAVEKAGKEAVEEAAEKLAKDAVDDVAQTTKKLGKESKLNHSTNPKDYLDEALSQQGLKEVPKGLKQKWIDRGYNYEVRIHPSEKQYTSSESIYRVARKKVASSDPKVQGTGTEYLGSDGNWYHESILKEFNRKGVANPLFNEDAARLTHIPLN